MRNDRAMRTARECVVILNGFFMDVPRFRSMPHAFNGVDLAYEKKSMYDILFPLVVLNHPVPDGYEGSVGDYLALWFDEGNLLKMELAFTGQKEGRAWEVLQTVWGDQDEALFESLKIFHTWYANPLHRVRALLYQLMEGDGIFKESWNLVLPLPPLREG